MSGRSPPSAEWWEGHRAGFAKGLEEARLQALDFVKMYPGSTIPLLRLAAYLSELKHQ
jgi:hypothetical protein